VVFVPAADVRLASVDVPARSVQKVLQAAPYALEDQLAEDVDELHFALGPRQPAGGYPVAVASKARMDAWHASLAQAGLRADAIVPEQLALPFTDDDRIHLLAEPDEFTARTGAFRGFACAPEDLSAVLKIADPESRCALRVLLAGDFNPDLSQLGRPVELLPGHRSALEVLVKHWKAEQSINLLQGAYSAREQINRNWAPWRLPAALAAGWVLASLVAGGVQTWRMRHEANAQDQRNVQRFQQLFPEETRIVGDLGAQLDSKLKAMKSAGTGGGMLKLLEPAAAALTSVPGLAVQSVQFREGALYLNLSGQSLESVDALQAWFDQHPGARMERDNINAGANGVQARVKLTAS
jgi:general secretion pathway protein L